MAMTESDSGIWGWDIYLYGDAKLNQLQSILCEMPEESLTRRRKSRGGYSWNQTRRNARREVYNCPKSEGGHCYA